jgi:hypothetical protein
MGLLNFIKGTSAAPPSLPKGSFSIDKNGRIISSTIPSHFSNENIEEIAAIVLKTFRSAQQAGVPLTEINFNFSSLKLTARELRGGAIIFLSPRELGRK